MTTEKIQTVDVVADVTAGVNGLVTIVINGVPQTTAAQTLAQWVDAQSLAANAVATAVNGQFVPRTLRAQTPLREGDTIVTFQPIEGG